jgi:hypothetical protein
MSALIAPFYQEWRAQRDSEARDSNLSALSRSCDDDHALSHSLQVRARPIPPYPPILLPPPPHFAARTITISMRSPPAGGVDALQTPFSGNWACLCGGGAAPRLALSAPHAPPRHAPAALVCSLPVRSVPAYRECRSRPRRPRTKGPSRALWPITCAGGCTRANP